MVNFPDGPEVILMVVLVMVMVMMMMMALVVMMMAVVVMLVILEEAFYNADNVGDYSFYQTDLICLFEMLGKDQTARQRS